MLQMELFQLRIGYHLKSHFLLIQDYFQLILDVLLEIDRFFDRFCHFISSDIGLTLIQKTLNKICHRLSIFGCFDIFERYRCNAVLSL